MDKKLKQKEKVKEKYSKKVQCDCGKYVQLWNMSAHKRSERHQTRMIVINYEKDMASRKAFDEDYKNAFDKEEFLENNKIEDYLKKDYRGLM